MMNSKKITELKKLNANQKDTINKLIEIIDCFADEHIKLQDENKKLKSENKQLKQVNRYLKLNYMYKGGFTHASDIIFPNTDERGLGEGDTPSDLSPLDL